MAEQPLATEHDLIACALALAYEYVALPQVREAFADRAKRAEGPPLSLLDALRKRGLTAAQAEKLDKAAVLVGRLKADAIYGKIAQNNRLVGAAVLNASMEEARRDGYRRSLGEILVEKRVFSVGVDRAITERRNEVATTLALTETNLLQSFDYSRDSVAMQERKLAILLGDVAAKISFMTKEDLEACLQGETAPPVRGGPAFAAGSSPSMAPSGIMAGGNGGEPAVAALIGPDDADEPIKGYQLLHKLGQGAMGSVIKAKKKDTGEVVAIKILKQELQKDREFVQRFMNEAKATQSLNHPNIIRALQIGRSADPAGREYWYYVMEFVDGETTSNLIKTKGKIGERMALSITRQIASALDHAWTRRIIHRDVKPDNIMVTKEGVAKLTDLGLARTVDRESTLTVTGVVMGSPAYISPEQATGEKNLDTRSDIYALGASLYHMLMGEVPYPGDSPLQVMLKHMNEPVPDARAKDPSISAGTQWLIQKMMAKRPEGRFQNARELELAIVKVEQALISPKSGAWKVPGDPVKPQLVAAPATTAVRAMGPGAPAATTATPRRVGSGEGPAVSNAADEEKKAALERLRRIGRKRRR